MKIVLTTLPRQGQFVNWTTSSKIFPKAVKYIPLGLLSLATNISGDHQVIILDPSSKDWTIGQIVKNIRDLNPDVVGINATTRRVYALYQILKKLDVPHIAVGGPLTTHYYNDVIKRGADTVFVGNLADIQFNDFINTKPLFKGVINCNTDINKISYPNRRLINLDDYIFNGKVLFEAKNRLRMFSSIGCRHKCTFCNVQSKNIMYKDPKIVVKQMMQLRDLKRGSIHILDDNFNASHRHLSSILDQMQRVKWNMQWSARGQVMMDPKLIPRMANLGFKRIHVGIESLDRAVLKSFRKVQNISSIKDFCINMHNNDIDILAYFVIGSPIQTPEYRKRLPQLIKDLNIRYPFFNVLFPQPNTQYYQSLLKDGIYKEDIWAKFMNDPIPNFQIPYPYGRNKGRQILQVTDSLINTFSSK